MGTAGAGIGERGMDWLEVGSGVCLCLDPLIPFTTGPRLRKCPGQHRYAEAASVESSTAAVQLPGPSSGQLFWLDFFPFIFGNKEELEPALKADGGIPGTRESSQSGWHSSQHSTEQCLESGGESWRGLNAALDDTHARG